jgi:hypothetical protein
MGLLKVSFALLLALTTGAPHIFARRGSAVITSHTRQNSASRRTINITVDPRIELLAVVQLLSDYGLINTSDSPYRRDVLKHFSAHKGHPAVKLFAQMYPTGFLFDAPPAAMLYLSDPPGLDVRLPFPDKLKQRAGGGESLTKFLGALRDFARETKFGPFFAAHSEMYARWVSDARGKLEGRDYIGNIEAYYGSQQHSYNIILAPLFHEGGFGPRLRRDDGTFDVYSIIGPSTIEKDVVAFGTPEGFRHLAWHEFSHSFINPLTEEHRARVAKYSSLHAPISDRMRQQGYSNWEGCVNEHVIRAVTSRIVLHQFGGEAASKALREESEQNFLYVEALYQRLAEYENRRDKYPTFRDFYPRLLDVFRELTEQPVARRHER